MANNWNNLVKGLSLSQKFQNCKGYAGVSASTGAISS